MANNLEVEKQTAIGALKKQGWSQRRIARELGIDRETVARSVRKLARAGHENRGGFSSSACGGSRRTGEAAIQGG